MNDAAAAPAQPLAVLSYSTSRWPARHLTFEDRGDEVRVIFGVWPRWMHIANVVIVATKALVITVAEFFLALLTYSPLGRSGGAFALPPQARDAFHGLVWFCALWASLGWTSAWWHYWRFRKLADVPRTLTATPRQLTYSQPGWFRLRERVYPAQDICAISIRGIRLNLNPRQTLAKLTIHRINDRPLRRRLASRDPELPFHIARRLADVLNCPLAKSA